MPDKRGVLLPCKAKKRSGPEPMLAQRVRNTVDLEGVVEGGAANREQHGGPESGRNLTLSDGTCIDGEEQIPLQGGTILPLDHALFDGSQQNRQHLLHPKIEVAQRRYVEEEEPVRAFRLDTR